jgi:hypothetical protein
MIYDLADTLFDLAAFCMMKAEDIYESEENKVRGWDYQQFGRHLEVLSEIARKQKL